jgi:hypothetical protein
MERVVIRIVAQILCVRSAVTNTSRTMSQIPSAQECDANVRLKRKILQFIVIGLKSVESRLCT